MLDFPQILLEEWAVFHPKNSINIIFFFSIFSLLEISIKTFVTYLKKNGVVSSYCNVHGVDAWFEF